jgi:hypothetical protein
VEIGEKVSKRHVPNADKARIVRCVSCGIPWMTARMCEPCAKSAAAFLLTTVEHQPEVHSR